MADDKSKRDYRDRDRINISEPYEVEYWTKKWGVSRAQLETAHRKVGPMVSNIARELGKSV